MVTPAIYKAREQFLTEGHIRRDLAAAVSPEVLKSWRRSKLSGARPDAPGLTLVSEETRESALTMAAEPVVAKLVEQFSGIMAGVLLADRYAKVLRRWAPDLVSLERMDRTCSAVGASGAEAEVGTNGIGTVAEERKARIVLGPEHFADIFTNHACIGAPIHHPLSRKFEGILTLSTDVDIASPLLLPMVMSTAREIEQRLLERSSRKERVLLDAFLTASRKAAAVAVIGEGVFMVSPRASRQLRGIDPSELWLRLREEVSESGKRHSIVLDVSGGTVCLTCEPIVLDGQLVGAVLSIIAAVDLTLLEALKGTPTPKATEAMFNDGLAPAGWLEACRSLPGSSAIWAEVMDAAAAQIHESAPLVVFGEPGVGKLSLLRAIHRATGQPEEAFRVIDCASASVADVLRPSNDEAARGTVVLRHLDALDDEQAAAIAALIEDRLSRSGIRIGATISVAEVEPRSAQQRRLFDILSIARIDVPPLRHHSEDITQIVAHLACRHSSSPLRLATKAMVALQRSPWPGNVRQLEAVIRGLLVSSQGREISVEMLPSDIGAHSRRRPLTPMEQLELDAILATLRRTGGNKLLAAQTLGISRSTLYRKMASYQLDPDLNFF